MTGEELDRLAAEEDLEHADDRSCCLPDDAVVLVSTDPAVQVVGFAVPRPAWWPASPFGHDYLSTACHHDRHDECRRVCKFCPSSCRCDCHTG